MMGEVLAQKMMVKMTITGEDSISELLRKVADAADQAGKESAAIGRETYQKMVGPNMSDRDRRFMEFAVQESTNCGAHTAYRLAFDEWSKKRKQHILKHGTKATQGS